MARANENIVVFTSFADENFHIKAEESFLMGERESPFCKIHLHRPRRQGCARSGVSASGSVVYGARACAGFLDEIGFSFSFNFNQVQGSMAASEDSMSDTSEVHFFEGVEKLLEIWFDTNPDNKLADLRNIPR